MNPWRTWGGRALWLALRALWLALRALWLALRAAPALAAAGYLLVYVALAIVHLRYPFELEWMEGGVVDHVQRVLDLRKLYVRPTLDFVPFIYTPLYYYVSAAFAKALGVGFLPLRLVSFLASLGALALVAAFVHRETRSRYASLLAAGLLAATYDQCAGFFDLARVDSLFLVLLLATLYVVRFDATRKGRLFGVVLLWLTFLTKQSAALVAVPLLVHVAVEDRRRSAWFVVPAVGSLVLSVIALQLLHRGWFLYYAYWIPQQHPWVERMVHAFWLKDLLAPLGVAVLAALFALLVAPAAGRRRFYALAGAGVLAMSWLGRLHAGGWSNVLMPTFAWLAVLFGIGVHEALCLAEPPAAAPPATGPQAIPASGRGAVAFVLVAALLQLAALGYDPRRYVPSERDARAARDLVRRIAAVDGDVLVLAHGYLTSLAGKPAHAHEMALSDILGVGGGKPGAALRRDILKALDDRRFALILLDTDALRREVQQRYARTGDALPEPDVMWSITGMRTRPRHAYAPRRTPAPQGP